MKKILLFSVIFIFLAGLGWGQAEFKWIGEGELGDWLDEDNWDGGDLPGDGNLPYKIIIQLTATANYPVFSGAVTGLECDILEIQSGASLNMGAFNLTVDTLVNLGELILTGSGTQSVTVNTTTTANDTVTFNGGGTRFAGLTTFDNLIIEDGIRDVADAITVSGNFSLLSGSLEAVEVSVTGTSFIAGNITTSGNQTYNGEVTFGGEGKILTSTGGNITANDAVTGTNITVNASQGISLNAVNALGGNIALNNDQIGNTPAGDITFTNSSSAINLSSTNNSAAGKIEIDQTGDLNITSLITNTGGSISIKATGEVNQTGAIETDNLKVETGTKITLDKDNIVNTVSLESNAMTSAQGNITYKSDVGTGKALNVTAVTIGNITITETTGSITVSGNIITTEDVTLNAGVNITVNSNISANKLTAKAGSAKFIEFKGIYVLEEIALESVNGRIILAGAEIKVTKDFELTNNETITLDSSAGSSIEAENIFLNDIIAVNEENLTLEANPISGIIKLNGTVGTSGELVGDITVVSADKVTFSGEIYAGNIGIISTDDVTFSMEVIAKKTEVTSAVVNIDADITTAGTQTYTGSVTLGGAGNRTLIGTTVTLGPVTGNAHSLLITGNGELEGGSGIGNLSVSGTSGIAGNITTSGTQTYSGAVTLDGNAVLNGSIVTLGAVTGNSHSLTITGHGVINGGSGISTLSVSGTSGIAGNITTSGTQTYSGAVTLSGNAVLTGTTVTLGAITGNTHSLTVTGNGVFNGGSGIGDLSISRTFSLTGGSLSAETVDVTGASNIAGDITSEGNQSYTSAVILEGPKRTITSQNGNIEFGATLGVIDETTDKIELLAESGKITVTGKIVAYQLIAKAAGDVKVYEIEIDSANNGKEGLGAAIYIEADSFIVTGTSNPPSSYYSIIPGGTGGQLCLVLNNTWTDSYFIDGPEDNPLGTVPDSRWHQHIFNLSGNNLVYGTLPSGLSVTPYLLIPDDYVKTTFILSPDKSVYINNADNTNASGLVFKTSGTGVIEFSGTNKFEKITLKTDSTGGINLVDTGITVNGDFELINNEAITLKTGKSSIDARNITLNVITAENNESLTLTAASGEINLNGTVGISGASVGDFTVNSAKKVTFSDFIYASNINVTSTDTTIDTDITTTGGTQIYTGTVTLGGTGTRTLTGTTVTLGEITGNSHSLTITGNGILNGGSGIDNLSVSDTTVINADITTTGIQIFTGIVTLGGAGSRTIEGTTVTLGAAITGNNQSLKIIGNNVELNGGSGIGDLLIKGNFTLASGLLSTATVDITGTSNIATNISTTGNQTYTGKVTLDDEVELNVSAGFKVKTGIIDGAAHSLTITGDIEFNDEVNGISILLVSGESVINANITTSGNQTYTGTVTLGEDINLVGTNITLGTITGNGKSLTITGDGVLNSVSGIKELSVSETTIIKGEITTTGNQTYSKAVTLDGAKRVVTSNDGNIKFEDTITSTGIIELSAAKGNISAGGKIEAYQLIAKAAGTVTVDEIAIDSSNTGKEGLNAAIYINAYDFSVTGTSDPLLSFYPVVPGGAGGQLCLELGKKWEDINNVVDGLEDDPPGKPGARWHQHFLVLTGKHLIYGELPPGFTLTSEYELVYANNVRTEFELDSGKNIYINNAVNTNPSGLTFKTSDTGFIEFSGTNKFEKISLESGSDGGIRLVNTSITITEGFILSNNETITLATDSALNIGKSNIEAGSITLNNITAENNESLSLTTTSGDINLNGTIGTSSELVGDITLVSADKVTFSGNVYAGNIDITSTGEIIIDADITTTVAQTYTGTITLGDTGDRILTGTTVTLGLIEGNGKSLTITGNGVLTGGSNIDNLSVVGNLNLSGGSLSAATVDVSGTSNITANVTASGTQTYTQQVELGGEVILEGTTVSLGIVTGNSHSLTITGNGVLTGGSDINNLTVSGDFSLAGGSLSAAIINVTGASSIAADITATGNQTYTGAVTFSGSDKRTITSQNGDIIIMDTLSAADKTKDIIELSALNGNVTVSKKIEAYQLIAKAAGIVTLAGIEIDPSNTGNEGLNAAVYIEADNFVATSTTVSSIIPGGKPAGAQWGQLCLVLNSKWTDANNVVDGPEDRIPPGVVSGARWHQHLSIIIEGKILYSFTEDSSGNGRLDRIRVQTNVALNGDFSGFDVSVNEYEIDRTKGVKGFQMVSDFTNALLFDNDSFYIYLIEKPEIDGGNTPLWSVTENESLANAAGSKVGDPDVDINIKPFDTIPPRIAYTLTLPGHPQTFMLVTEPVVSSSGADISVSFGGLSVQGINKIQPDGLKFLFNLSGSFKIEDLAKNIDSSALDSGYFRIDAVDQGQKAEDLSVNDPDAQPPKYPLNWGYTEYAKVYANGSIQNAAGSNPVSGVFTPPNKILAADMMRKLANNQGNLVKPNNDPVIRRATDVLVSMAPADTNSDNYFAWPVWARFKKSLNAPYTVGNDIFWGQQPTDTGIIWQFDGSSFLETNYFDTNEGLELQARLNNNLVGAPVLFWTTAEIPAEYRNPQEAAEAKKAGGLWLPNVITNPLYNYVNYVPMSYGINGKSADSSSSKLYNYVITADSLTVNSGDKFEFILRLSDTSDMFIARLDIPRGAAIPTNWYTLIRPFVFEIQNIRRQRGGVSVLNNVINSNNREIAYIRYHLPRPGRVTVQIYTLDGTLIKSLRRNEQRDAGEWTDSWDGTNNGGRAVARGMYFVRVVGPDIDEIRKIMVVK